MLTSNTAFYLYNERSNLTTVRLQVFASFAWTVVVLLRPIHNLLLNPGYSIGLDCFSWVYITVCCISGASFSGYKDYDTAKASTIKSLEIVAYLCAFIMVLVRETKGNKLSFLFPIFFFF